VLNFSSNNRSCGANTKSGWIEKQTGKLEGTWKEILQLFCER